jgi:hypothetical protein
MSFKTNQSSPKSGGFVVCTKKGYNMFDVSSALQKAVRRGELDEASYWAWELINSNYEKYLWKRLLIMATEDIGLADPEAMRNAQFFYENYKILKELDTFERTRPIMAAVYVLATAKKSQFFNWFWGKHMDEHNSFNLPIPAHALDKHTRRGKRAGKNTADFFEEGSLINNHAPVADEVELKERSAEYHRTINDPKWKQCEFLPMSHPDRDPAAPKTTAAGPIRTAGTSDDGSPVAATRRRVVRAEADDNQPTLL